MPIVEVSPGNFVDFEEGTPQKVIDGYVRKAGGNPSQVRATTNTRAAPTAQDRSGLSADERAEVSKRVAFSKRNGMQPGIFNQLTRGYLSNFDDEISGITNAAVQGIPQAISKGDFSQIGRSYRVGAETARQEQRNYEQDNKVSAIAAQLAGAIAAPIGTGAGLLTKGGVRLAKVAPRAGGAMAAVGDKLARGGPLIQGALQGASGGALAAMGEQEGGLQERAAAALRGAQGGALFGGALGAARTGIGAAGRILKDHGADAAERVAYSRIGSMLDRAPQAPKSTVMHTPGTAASEIAASRAQGVSATVGDLSPELQATKAYMARKPNLLGGNQIRYEGEGQLAARGGNYETALRGALKPATGTDTFARKQATTGARRQAGKVDYQQALDDSIPVSDHMMGLAESKNPLVRGALKSAHRQVLEDDLDPSQIGFRANDAGDIEEIAIPTWRTFDYIKRGFGRTAEEAKAAGNFDLARKIDAQFVQLRQAMSEANPKYAETLATQRSFFEKNDAVDFGKTVLQRLSGKGAVPGQVLSEMRSLPKHAREDLRTGITEYLLNLRNGSEDPSRLIMRMIRNPNQRQVLMEAFGGSRNLNEFNKWLYREMRANQTAARTSGPQSISSDMMLMDAADNEQAAGKLFGRRVLQGFGFGGGVGAAGNATNTLGMLTRTMSTASKEKLAKILMGDGSDLEAGISKAKQFDKARRRSNIGTAKRWGKAGGYLMGTTLGGSE